MRITVLLVALTVVGCGGAMDAAAPGSMPATETGGTGGSQMAMGGSGGSGGTGGQATGGSGGTAGTGGQVGSDAGTAADTMPAMSMDTRSADTQPASTGAPKVCDPGSKVLYTDVCMDPPNTKGGKILHKDGRVCIFCATYKSDGRTVDKQFTGCLDSIGGDLCVMSCGECQ